MSCTAAPIDFTEIEPPLTEAEARAAAGRCLDCGVCSECHECVEACPADAIDLRARDEDVDVDVGASSWLDRLQAVPGRPQAAVRLRPFKNVITGHADGPAARADPAVQHDPAPGRRQGPRADRLRHVHRLARRDGRQPALLAFCCMYSIKQNQLIMGALPLADVTVHYMDIRAPGKRYDEFYEQAKAMGATYVKGRVAKITEKPDGNLILRYEDIENGGGIAEAEYDLVVLAVGCPAEPRRRALLFDEGSSRSTSSTTSPSPRRTSTRARRASRASSSPAPRRAPRTSPTRSCTPEPPSRRSRRISSAAHAEGRGRGGEHERR